MQALDAKIQQWSLGKKGNIRSLLSTLQFVRFFIHFPFYHPFMGNKFLSALHGIAIS